VMSVVFGIEANCMKNEAAEFAQLPQKIFNWRNRLRAMELNYIFIAPVLAKLLRFSFLESFTGNFLKEVLTKTIAERERNGTKRNDFVDLLVAIKKEEEAAGSKVLDGDKIIAQGISFYIAGFESSSSTISLTMWELAKNVELQKKLRQELVEVREKGGGKFTYDVLKEAKYLDMCLKETLRKYPVLPFLDRRCNKDYEVPGHDLVIERGTPVYICLTGLQFDPKYYEEPDEYKPERFSSDQSIHSFTWMPFGEGPRICIGERFAWLSTKIAVAHIISDYEVCTCAKTPNKLKFIREGFLLLPKEGVPLTFKRL